MTERFRLLLAEADSLPVGDQRRLIGLLEAQMLAEKLEAVIRVLLAEREMTGIATSIEDRRLDEFLSGFESWGNERPPPRVH